MSTAQHSVRLSIHAISFDFVWKISWRRLKAPRGLARRLGSGLPGLGRGPSLSAQSASCHSHIATTTTTTDIRHNPAPLHTTPARQTSQTPHTSIPPTRQCVSHHSHIVTYPKSPPTPPPHTNNPRTITPLHHITTHERARRHDRNPKNQQTQQSPRHSKPRPPSQSPKVPATTHT